MKRSSLTLGLFLLGSPAASPAATDPESISRIYVVNQDGTGLRLIADETVFPDHTFLGSPAWSPDGRWIVFDSTKDYKFSHTRIAKVAVTGPEQGQVVNLGIGLGGNFSPDGKRIAFFLNSNNPIEAQSGLWVMNADGTNRQRLAWGLYPQWSPDGRQILCANSHKNPREILLFDLDPFKRRVLLTNQTCLGLPTWAPDGRRIALTVRDGDDRVLTLFTPEENSAGGEILWRENWTNTYEETWPDWSPDGRWIVFTHFGRTAGHDSEILMVKPVAGNQPTPFGGHFPNAYIRDCEWSPDGTQITFAAVGSAMLQAAAPQAPQ